MKLFRCVLFLIASLLVISLQECFSGNGAQAQSAVVTTSGDRALAEKILHNLENGPTGKMMIFAAREMLGTPYVAGSLDGGDIEELRVYLTRTDCMIFVETCLNLARAVKTFGNDADFDRFASMIRQTRYRDGRISDYSDRLHYTTEWIRQGEEEGILEDITLSLGGKSYDHKISYMSSHPDAYPHVNSSNLPMIKQAEDRLNREEMTCIPSDKIHAVEGGIQDGDIVCFVSKIEGLDISHMCLAYRYEGKLRFIHASTKAGKVVIDNMSIAEYALSRPKSVAGIKVVRPK